MAKTIEPQDPTVIDWPARQARAAIPFTVRQGRPVNPCAQTGRQGLGELWAWGETLASDALVTATTLDGRRWLLMIERGDGHGWAVPGGCVEPGEDPADAAVRELQEETGLRLTEGWTVTPPRYVPDPRATDEAWMVTVVCTLDLGRLPRQELPAVAGGDDAARAAWIPAPSFTALAAYLADTYGGQLFAAHVPMLAAHLQ